MDSFLWEKLNSFETFWALYSGTCNYPDLPKNLAFYREAMKTVLGSDKKVDRNF